MPAISADVSLNQTIPSFSYPVFPKSVAVTNRAFSTCIFTSYVFVLYVCRQFGILLCGRKRHCAKCASGVHKGSRIQLFCPVQNRGSPIKIRFTPIDPWGRVAILITPLTRTNRINFLKNMYPPRIIHPPRRKAVRLAPTLPPPTPDQLLFTKVGRTSLSIARATNKPPLRHRSQLFPPRADAREPCKAYPC